MPLNCDWIKICVACGKFWCDKGARCGSTECECTEYLTVKDFQHDMVKMVTCGACEKSFRQWLESQFSRLVLRLEGK